MGKLQIALIRWATYDPVAVYDAVKRGVDLLGGMKQFVKSGEKILLKPNVLSGASPEKCVTTHPVVFRAAGRLLKESGANVYYGDSPCLGSNAGVMRKARLKAVVDELGLTLADFDGGRIVNDKKLLFDGKIIK